MANPKFEAVSGTPTFTFPDECLPALPSDEYADDVRRIRDQIRHKRHETPIAIYREDTFREWEMKMISISKANTKLFRQFFDDMSVFLYFPDSSVPTTYYQVEILEDTYNAKYNGGGTYDLSFTIRET